MPWYTRLKRMSPAFLLTTTNYLLAFDGHERFFQVHTGTGLYYGLARDGRHIYVSCRNQTIGPHAAARASESGSIRVFDAASLSPA
jgi:hypothetical protein